MLSRGRRLTVCKGALRIHILIAVGHEFCLCFVARPSESLGLQRAKLFARPALRDVFGPGFTPLAAFALGGVKGS